MKLIAKDDDNPRCTAEVELFLGSREEEGKYRELLEQGDTDAVLEALRETYEAEDDPSLCANYRTFVDDVERMGSAVVMEKEEE